MCQCSGVISVAALLSHLLGCSCDSCRLVACCTSRGNPCRIHPLQLQSSRLRRSSRTCSTSESGTEAAGNNRLSTNQTHTQLSGHELPVLAEQVSRAGFWISVSSSSSVVDKHHQQRDVYSFCFVIKASLTVVVAFFRCLFGTHVGDY